MASAANAGTKTSHKLHQKSKRGGTFTRRQLEIMKEYLKTKKVPNRAKLLQAKFPLDSVMKEPKPLFLAACRRLALSGENLCHTKDNRLVIPMEEFVSKIREVHEGDYKDILHLNYIETLMKLSDLYTIGRRKYGMSKDLIEAVVKSCNSGPCYRKKRSTKKIIFDEKIRKFEKKCLELNAVTSSFNENEIGENSHDRVNIQDDVSNGSNGKAKKRKKYKQKNTANSDVKKMPTLVQMLNKPVVAEIETTETSTSTSGAMTTVNKPTTIAIGPVSIQTQPGKENSQYQLGILVPVITTTTDTNGQQNLAVTSTAPSTQALCIPIKTIGTATSRNRTTSTETCSSSQPTMMDASRNSTKTITISQMHFSKLLQNLAKNSKGDKNAQVSFTFSANPLTCNATSKDKGEASVSVTMTTVNEADKTKCSISGNHLASNKTDKQASVKRHLQDLIEIKKKEMELAEHSLELSKMNLKLCKQKLALNALRLETLSHTTPKKKMKRSNPKEDQGNTLRKPVQIKSDKESHQGMNTYDTDQNNNTAETIRSGHKPADYDTNVSWTEENHKVSNDQTYKHCLQALCSLAGNDFEAVTDQMYRNLFSEEPHDISYDDIAMGDPPYPNIWYFYSDICLEKNLFQRLLIVIKDIRIDWMKCLMQELLARDRLKKKLNYMEVLVRRNKDYLNYCTVSKLNRQESKETQEGTDQRKIDYQCVQESKTISKQES